MQHKKTEFMTEIENFVNAFYMENHRSPSVREIAGGTTLQRSAVHKYLVAMNAEGRIRYDGKEIRTDRIDASDYETTPVTVFDASIACGLPNMTDAAADRFTELPASLFGQGPFCLLRANGDSMVDAGIGDRDLVLIRPQETAEDGEVAAVYVTGEGNTLKRVFHLPGQQVLLQAENSAQRDTYPNTKWPEQDCRIQGVAVWAFKPLKRNMKMHEEPKGSD